MNFHSAIINHIQLYSTEKRSDFQFSSFKVGDFTD